MRQIRRVGLTVAIGLVVLYVGDYLAARYRLPGNRQTLQTVEVQTMWAIKTKNGRIDYELGDAETETCLVSLFPHLGYQPCWWVRRHTSKVITVGRIDRKEFLFPPKRRELISC